MSNEFFHAFCEVCMRTLPRETFRAMLKAAHAKTVERASQKKRIDAAVNGELTRLGWDLDKS